jgi:ribosomal protein S18 acetylase RimI-like enzyme
MSAPALGQDRASPQQIADHLRACDADFVPPLSARVDIAGYAQKIATSARRHEAWADGELVGLVAVYCNQAARDAAFITSVSVLPGWRGRQLGEQLLRACLAEVEALGFARVELEVDARNPAVALYRRHGFSAAATTGTLLRMTRRRA